MTRIAKRLGLLLAVALVLLWTPEPAAAENGPLDGKTFAGEMTEKGKTKGDADTFVFRDGKFRSTACDAYGFTETAYTSAVSDVSTRFEAEATSPREGTMKWKGTVRGDSLEGTAVWTKKGQADAVYTFKGTLKK
jgi:hypothetical protein